MWCSYLSSTSSSPLFLSLSSSSGEEAAVSTNWRDIKFSLHSAQQVLYWISLIRGGKWCNTANKITHHHHKQWNQISRCKFHGMIYTSSHDMTVVCTLYTKWYIDYVHIYVKTSLIPQWKRRAPRSMCVNSNSVPKTPLQSFPLHNHLDITSSLWWAVECLSTFPFP